MSLVLALSVPTLGMSAALFLSSLLCLIGILRAFRRGFRPVALVFYTFMYCWIVVASAIQINLGVAAWRDSFVLKDQRQVTTALTLTLVALIAFGAGEFLNRTGQRVSKPVKHYSIRGWAVLGYGALLIALTPLVIRSAGGIAGLFSSRSELAAYRRSSGVSLDALGGPMYALVRILPAALAISLILLLIALAQQHESDSSRYKRTMFLAFLVFVVTLLVFVNPFTSTRYTVATLLGATTLAYFRIRSPRIGLLAALGMMFAILVAYPFGNSFRTGESVSLRSGVEAYTGPDFDGFQQIINTLAYVQESGYTFGNHILSGIGFFVPRSIWEDKAEPASYAIAESAGYSWTNLSLPLHAEFYLEFGWMGMFALMILTGWLAARLDDIWLFSASPAQGLISAYIAFAMLGILRGPIGAQIPTWGMVVLLLLVALRSSSITIDELKREEV